jgi:Flp pilus assembly protein TadD
MSKKKPSRPSATPDPRAIPVDHSGKWWPFALVALVAGLLFLPTASFEFIDLDDTLLIVDNRDFLSDPGHVVQAFRQSFFTVPGYKDRPTYYRPMVTISYMMDMARGGPLPRPYHTTNLLLHIVCSCLLLRLLLRLGARHTPALLLALLFAVHPAFASVVAWVPGRNDSLLGVFALLSLLGLLRFLDRRSWWGFTLHSTCFLLAFFTKEAAAALVPIFVLLLARPEKARPSRATAALLCGTWLLVSASWYLLRQGAVEALPPRFMIESILANSSQLVPLLGKCVIPAGLSAYPVRQDTSFLPGVLTLAALAFLALRGRRRWLLVLGGSWFVLFLVPTLVLDKPWDRAVFYEHRLYLPSMGLAIFLASVDLRLPGRRVGLLLAGLLVTTFAGLTLVRQRPYSSRLNFWRDAVATSPSSSLAHMNLGVALALKKRLDEAEKPLLRSLEIDPAQPSAHYNLGVLYRERGDANRALEMFRRETEVAPEHIQAHFDLGVLLARRGHVDEAVHAWERVLELDPFMTQAYELLAIAACEKRDLERARGYLVEQQARGGRLSDYARSKLEPHLGKLP